jgi:hypothetical protein
MTMDRTEFWRDVEACQRLPSPEDAICFVRSLIVVRANFELPDESGRSDGYYKIEALKLELWNEYKARGYTVPIRHILILSSR